MEKDTKAFLRIKREKTQYRPVCERVKDYKDVAQSRDKELSENQAHRCMDCGVPFCHWACPVGNLIPEWNDAVMAGQWEKAFKLLNDTNNLPEITGRVCPATCEFGCVLGINDDPVTIRENELDIIENGFAKKYIKAYPPKTRTNKKVAVIGSGPAGLSAASQLNRAGHNVTVFEQDDKVGGIMRFGIPDFKLEKSILDRRIKLWLAEGIEFKVNTEVGEDLKTSDLLKDFDAVCLAIGSRVPRDLKIEGRELKGIHFAMDYLTQSNRIVDNTEILPENLINAKDKKVVVIGGGDTGSDCVGTANRQGASCVVQIEVMPRPQDCRTEDFPWPNYPLLLKTTSSHQEGAERSWAVLTKEFIGANGQVKKLKCMEVEFVKDEKGCPVMKEIEGTDLIIDADLVLLAVGFVHPQHSGLVKDLGLNLDKRGNLKTDDNYMTSKKAVFAAGDARRGQSLVVWAISEGRKSAHAIDKYLMGDSVLPNF